MASAQVQKVDSEVHIKSPAKQFYDVMSNRTHHLANVYPEKIKSVDILKGEWGSQGSIICWNFVHDGKMCVAKEVVEFDKENNKMVFKVFEGDLMEHYKSFVFLMDVSPKENGSVVRWTLQYEKLKDNTPDPHSILQIDINMTKALDAHLVAAN